MFTCLAPVEALSFPLLFGSPVSWTAGVLGKRRELVQVLFKSSPLLEGKKKKKSESITP